MTAADYFATGKMRYTMKVLVNHRCMKGGVVKRNGAERGSLSLLCTASRYVNVPVRSVHGFAACTPNTKTLNHPPTSTHNNSVNMALIDDALAVIKARELREEIVYQHYANKYSVARSTLSRRHRRVCRSREDYAADKQLLAPAQEAELVEYINSLTKQGLPPTQEIIQNFSSTIAP
jgi:hypothetical protein